MMPAPFSAMEGMLTMLPRALFFLLLLLHPLPAAEPLRGVRQLIVSIAPGWDSSQGRLQLFQRAADDAPWQPHGSVFPVLYGSAGLAWGRGVRGQGEPGVQKKEHDRRAPAGLFKIGRIYTYDDALPTGADYPFHTVGLWDAWIDDVTLPHYNQFVSVDPANPPPWFSSEKMRHGDFAYRWLVEIRHNADPPVPGAGSAIFFHLRRGATRPTAGCTCLAEENLVALIRWLRAGDEPHYVLLPRAEYLARIKDWNLPPANLAPVD